MHVVRARFLDGPLVGKWRTLQVGQDGLPPESIRIYGLLGVPIEAGGVQRCVVYRRVDDTVSVRAEWSYSYDRDEPYEGSPLTDLA